MNMAELRALKGTLDSIVDGTDKILAVRSEPNLTAVTATVQGRNRLAVSRQQVVFGQRWFPAGLRGSAAWRVWGTGTARAVAVGPDAGALVRELRPVVLSRLMVERVPADLLDDLAAAFREVGLSFPKGPLVAAAWWVGEPVGWAVPALSDETLIDGGLVPVFGSLGPDVAPDDQAALATRRAAWAEAVAAAPVVERPTIDGWTRRVAVVTRDPAQRGLFRTRAWGADIGAPIYVPV